MRKKIHVAIIASMCAVIAMSAISMTQSYDESPDDFPDEIIFHVALTSLIFYIIIRFSKNLNLTFTLTGIKHKGDGPEPAWFDMPGQRFVMRVFPIFAIFIGITAAIAFIWLIWVFYFKS